MLVAQWVAGRWGKLEAELRRPVPGSVFDGHGPEEGVVRFHGHNTRSIVGIGGADQGPKAERVICYKKMIRKCLVKPTFLQCGMNLSALTKHTWARAWIEDMWNVGGRNTGHGILKLEVFLTCWSLSCWGWWLVIDLSDICHSHSKVH